MARVSKTGLQVAAIKADDLYGIVLKARGEASPLSNDKITADLFAAEDFYERDLQIKFNPTRVFSDVRVRNMFPDSSMHVTDFDELEDIEDPAYDYESRMWANERWGEIKLNWRPVRDVTRVILSAPGSIKAYSVPPDWIVLDRRYGVMQIRPGSGPAVLLTFLGSNLALAGAGRGIPMSIYVDYVTGFTPELLEAHHQDLLRAIRLRTILGTLQTISGALTPGGAQGGSLSLDGMSRSRSFGGKWGPYSGAIEMALAEEEKFRDAWKTKEKGIQLAFITGA